MKTRTLLTGAALGLLFLVGAPQTADAQVQASWTSVWMSGEICSETSFNPCVEFELWKTGDQNAGGNDIYSFIVRYTSVNELAAGDNTGYITAAGLYDYDGGGNWTGNFEDVTLIVPNSEDWSEGADADCQQLSGGGAVIFQACVATTDGINGGAAYDGGNGFVQFNFAYAPDIGDGDPAELTADNFAALVGDLGARNMIQGVGPEDVDCSFKLDSPQGFVSGCDGPVIPEPSTVILLATGLIGVGAVGYKNRRKEEEEV
ncbi:MAG: PEP-CTERM sorting domain-containing protein [Anaerolineales bacterium]|nr:PEP-CTERM sorting domain-containing protein [Anaerolineales bacterium]